MTKLRLPLRRWALVAAMFLAALAALLPMRLALSFFDFERGLAARGASGSVWLGALHDARLGPVPLGDLHARLNLLPLLVGRARLSLEASGPSGNLEGAVSASRHTMGIDDVSGDIRAGPLFGALPIAQLSLDDVSAGFEAGTCTRGEGRVTALLAGQAASLAGNGLTGRARCAGRALLIPLISRTGSESLSFRLFADGRYRIDLAVRTADPAMRAGLTTAGFRMAGPAMVLVSVGRF